MNAFLLSATGTIVSAAIGLLAVGIIIFSIVRGVIRKKQGKSGCDFCDHCAGNCTACHTRSDPPDQTK